MLTLGSRNVSERSLRIDERLGYFITLIGIPSAFLLHGYVGFIFGSIKANPWWSSPLMPIVFVFSAMVSGISAVMLLYMLSTRLRGKEIDMRCLDKIAQYLLYTFIIDFSLEMLDLLQRIYEADESFRSLDFMVHTRLWTSQVIVQILLGTVTPIALLGLTQILKLSDIARKRIYGLAGCLTMIGIFAMRWNVVIGGQLFSKSFLGYTTYKMAFATREGLLTAIALMILPFIILWVLVKLLPPWPESDSLPGCGRSGTRNQLGPISFGADAEKRMAQAFDGIASDVEQLSERVRELERRVSTLEGQPANAIRCSLPHLWSVALPKSRPPETWRGFPAPNVSAGVLPVFGKAVLGIAGAYLLRAVAESGTIPRLPVLMVAIVYAGMWLVWAVRTHATNRFASVTYAITAALILSPLLWESTVRFQMLPPAFTAAVLVAFVVLALALAWRQNLQAIPWVATLAAVATALALIIATRELVPFTAGLLAVALATEVVVCLGHRLSVRALPAIAADFAVWLLVYLMTSPEGVPPEYRPIECNDDHGAVPGAACDLRRKHWHAQSLDCATG